MYDKIIKAYTEQFPSEDLESLLFLMKNFPDKCTSPILAEGHITAGAIVCDELFRNVLIAPIEENPELLLHFGGHIERYDISVYDFVRERAAKKMGINPRELQYFQYHINPSVPIDIDKHHIKDKYYDKNHYHFDFRYLFQFPKEKSLKNADANDLRWTDIEYFTRMTTFTKIHTKILEIKAGLLSPKIFYSNVLRAIGYQNESRPTSPAIRSLVVPHLLPDVMPFIDSLNALHPIYAIIPKPKSIVEKVKSEIKLRYKDALKEDITRDNLNEKLVDVLSDLYEDKSAKLIIYDIGGWFSDSVNHLLELFGEERFLGIIEDTENGIKKYENAYKTYSKKIPIVSVARSPLKDNEDFLIGDSIVFSTDAILRELGVLLQYLTVSIFGYGKIGKAIARAMLSAGVKPNVHDRDPVVQISAINQGCISRSPEWILANSDVVFCATGSHALDILKFRQLRNGCYVVSVTSSDDEFNLKFLPEEYSVTPDERTRNVTKISSPTNYFYMLNNGNAVNFLHGAVVGNFIHLVKAEMLVAGNLVAGGKLPRKITHGVTRNFLETISSAWLDANSYDYKMHGE